MAGSLVHEGPFSMRRAGITKPLMKYFNCPGGKIDTSKVGNHWKQTKHGPALSHLLSHSHSHSHFTSLTLLSLLSLWGYGGPGLGG
jgi:hypothetical protein